MGEWTKGRLGALAEVLDSRRVPVREEDRPTGSVPYYGANGQQGWIDRALFDEPLILLAEDGGHFDDFAHRPIAYRIEGPSWVNNHAHVLRSAAGVNHNYLFWSLRNKDIRKWIAGGTRSKLTRGEMEQIEILLPPLNEQQRIAEILDTIDEVIQANKHIISKRKMKLDGLIEDLTDRWVRYTKTQLPLGKLLQLKMDFRGRTPKKLGMAWGEGRIPALSANNVQMGEIDFTKECYLGSENLYRRWMTKGRVARGDLLITMEAPLGNIARVPDDSRYILSQRVVLLRFSPNLLLNDFAYWYMRSQHFQSELRRRSTGTTATGIRRAQLEEIEVPLVDLHQQQTVATALSAQEFTLSCEERALEKLCEIRAGLAADLLSGRVRTVVA